MIIQMIVFFTAPFIYLWYPNGLAIFFNYSLFIFSPCLKSSGSKKENDLNKFGFFGKSIFLKSLNK